MRHPLGAGTAGGGLSSARLAQTRKLLAPYRAGFRAGVPFGLAALFLGVSFGILALSVGMGTVAPGAMSAMVFAGSAQFAAVAVLADGGGAGAAIVAAVLMNARYGPMGVAVASSLPGRRLRRALEGQAVVDASWALASRGKGRFDRDFLLGATLAQWPGWVGGTVIGVLGGDLIGDPERLGLDAIFPAFFLGLMWEEIRDRGALASAGGGAAIALALTPVTPPGVPILAASLAVLIGVRRR